MGQDKKLTMQTVVERKEAKRLSFADSRYITRGNLFNSSLAMTFTGRPPGWPHPQNPSSHDQ